jgi:hypothetical protein
MSSSIDLEGILNPIVKSVYIKATNSIVPIGTISILTIKNILKITMITILNTFNLNNFHLILAIIGLILMLSNIYTTIVVVYYL